MVLFRSLLNIAWARVSRIFHHWDPEDSVRSTREQRDRVESTICASAAAIVRDVATIKHAMLSTRRTAAAPSTRTLALVHKGRDDRGTLSVRE
jgi:hypothetical protein